jgi:hypothetical protein
MKPSITYRVSAVLLSLLVVFSTLSFKVEKHICKGDVYTSFFDNAEVLCNMDSHACHTEEEPTESCTLSHGEEGCCINIYEVIEGLNIEQPALEELRVAASFFAVVFSSHFSISLYTPFSAGFLEPNTSSLFFSDLGILFQVFRI